jgi:ectoine hydroxylase-related dioxygenase (phytanoyl-CoA dioxygenase family)
MKNRYVMSDEEKYFFDLTGYLIVRGALSPEEVAECNAAIDHYAEDIHARSVEGGGLARGSSALKGETGRLELTGMLGWPSPYREPFRKLLAHPIVVSRLNEMSGKGFRLDHGPLMIGAEAGTEGHQLHGAGEPFSPAVWYHQQNGRISCRGVTVAWQLYDVNEGDGGFCIAPGSHKSRFRPPKGVITVEDDMGLVKQPAMKAGDVLFFAETATHGTLPWKGKQPRRSILYKYASRAAARAVGRRFTPEERYGAWTKELTPEQHSLLYGPGHHTGNKKRYALESDGEKVWLVD